MERPTDAHDWLTSNRSRRKPPPPSPPEKTQAVQKTIRHVYMKRTPWRHPHATVTKNKTGSRLNVRWHGSSSRARLVAVVRNGVNVFNLGIYRQGNAACTICWKRKGVAQTCLMSQCTSSSNPALFIRRLPCTLDERRHTRKDKTIPRTWVGGPTTKRPMEALKCIAPVAMCFTVAT